MSPLRFEASDPRPRANLDALSRRVFLSRSASGLGAIALAWMLGDGARAAVPASGDGERLPHFKPTAKRVVVLHMTGSPPQQDLWDHKPKLKELDGKPCPAEFLAKERFAFIKGHPKLLASPYEFAQHGSSGAWVSSLLPEFRSIVDDVTLVRSMHTDQFNHAPAELFLYSGSPRVGRPSMGSWVVYGLGSENADLPGYIVLTSGGRNPSSGKSVDRKSVV